jgi:DNA repair protein RadD
VARVLDHSGAVFRHGFVEDPVSWTLDPDLRATNPKHAARSEDPASRLLECTQCGALRLAGEPCGHCGFLPQRPPRAISFEDGDLAEIGRDRRTTPNIYDPELRNRWHAMFVHIATERGYKPGWTAYKYKEKFNAWPAWGGRPQPIEPTPEVRSWVRSRQIAYAKSRNAA